MRTQTEEGVLPMTLQQRRTVLLYQLYMVVSEPLFWGPIVIYSLLTLAHMSLTEIFFMEAIVMMVLVMSNVPAGALADVIGKKRAVLIGRFLLLVSIICFATMTSSLLAWVGNLAWAFGFALTSGSESSLLFETLKNGSGTKRFKEVQGKAIGYRFLVIALACLLVGVLAEVHPRLPLYLSVPGQVLAFLLVIGMTEPGTTTTFSRKAQWRAIKEGLRFVKNTPVVLWMVLFAALVGVISKVWFFTYNPYFELVGMPVSHYGFVFFLLNIVAWLSSHYAYKIETVMSEFGLVVFSIACLSVPILLMALFPSYLVAYLVLAQNIVRGFIRPFTEDFVHHHIRDAEAEAARATIMSVKSAVSQFMMVCGLFGASFALEYFSLISVLLGLGVIASILGTVAILSYKRVVRVTL